MLTSHFGYQDKGGEGRILRPVRLGEFVRQQPRREVVSQRKKKKKVERARHHRKTTANGKEVALERGGGRPAGGMWGNGSFLRYSDDKGSLLPRKRVTGKRAKRGGKQRANHGRRVLTAVKIFRSQESSEVLKRAASSTKREKGEGGLNDEPTTRKENALSRKPCTGLSMGAISQGSPTSKARSRAPRKRGRQRT